MLLKYHCTAWWSESGAGYYSMALVNLSYYKSEGWLKNDDDKLESVEQRSQVLQNAINEVLQSTVQHGGKGVSY